MITRRRIPWLAGLANLLAAPVGHVYAGEPVRGVAVYCTVLVVGTIVLVSSLYVTSALAFVALMSLMVISCVAVVADAYAIARRAGQSYELRRFNRWYVYAALAVGAGILSNALAGVVRRDLVQAYRVPSGSMIPTLLIGDHFLANKLAYRVGKPQRFDIAVFEYPKDPAMTFVMRIVGITGDTVEIRDGVLWLNGSPIEEPYKGSIGGSLNTFGPVRVPVGGYFVLGDNRGQSADSRFWGTVPGDKIWGRVQVVYWSWDRSESAARWSRIGKWVR